MDDNRHNRKIGKKGEEMVCNLLISRGHSIMERNWRCGHLEIDIISRDRNGIHFVEVKTRCSSEEVQPQESVGKMKQEHIRKAALRYIASRQTPAVMDEEFHFDVVAVTVESSGTARIRIFEDAYFPGLNP